MSRKQRKSNEPHRSNVGVYRDSVPPESPCPWTPKTEGKVLTLCERADKGLDLWHPDDAVVEDVYTVNKKVRLPPMVMSYSWFDLNVTTCKDPTAFWFPRNKAGRTTSEDD